MTTQSYITLMNFLKVSQWRSAEEIQRQQKKHLMKLIQHVFYETDFYKSLYSKFAHNILQGEVEIEQLPVLTRVKLQSVKDETIISKNIPKQHGELYEQVTSGTTGIPIKTISSDFCRVFNELLILREHDWSQRDLSKKLLTIHWAKKGFAKAPIGQYQADWGPPIHNYKKTGPAIFMNIAGLISKQIEGILHYQPDFIFSYPSHLVALASHCDDKKIKLPFLKEIRTTGETLSTIQINTIKNSWPGLKMRDVYSCVEIGVIAQQCSERNYHVNAEHLLLEIVDEKNLPCPIGIPGRVLVTSLLNYAKPLIRYELGDYAEWGPPCICGRGLPVLSKILGRQRHRLMYPNGESVFPYLGEREDYYKITKSILKFQFIQHTMHDIEVKLVVKSPLTSMQQQQLISLFQKNLGYSFNIMLNFQEHILPGKNGKYEEFLSKVN